ncbi:MAG: NAD(P)-dependent oxidoreductase [Flavobacteriaceae bacterium]
MKQKLIIHIDENHPTLIKGLKKLGYKNDKYYNSDLRTILDRIKDYNGLVIRSRFKIDKTFIDKAKNLDFIARVGSGTENIDVNYAISKNISIINAPEGNKDAVGEHALGMLLSLTNNLFSANESIKKGIWKREKFRGHEINGKTVGIIGYGNMGKSFAYKLKGFNCNVICYDIKKNLGDINSKQVSLIELQNKSEIISLHLPLSVSTKKMINKNFINQMKNPFWLINTARGNVIETDDVVEALKSKKIIGVALDVLEYESSSFESIFKKNNESLDYLIKAKNVILSPHIAGWTYESHKKLAKIILNKLTKII